MAVIPLLVFALFLVALIDIILRTGDQIRHLPKLAWIVVVILLPLIGSVLWFGLGRERSGMRAPRPAAADRDRPRVRADARRSHHRRAARSAGA